MVIYGRLAQEEDIVFQDYLFISYTVPDIQFYSI